MVILISNYNYYNEMCILTELPCILTELHILIGKYYELVTSHMLVF